MRPHPPQPLRSRLLIALACAVFSASAEARRWGSLMFEACTLAPRQGIAAIEAQCTRLEVPEDPAQPDGRRIELALAWIPASGNAEPDPVLMIAGGPGQSARDSFPGLAPAFRDLNRNRHILLLDQRGTGGSNLLTCPAPDEMEAAAWDEDEATIRAWTEACRDRLAEQADLGLYTTTEAVADLEALRVALGAPTLNLIGVSYGSRVAQQYALRHPQTTRSLVLDGVVPNTLVLGAEFAVNLEASLDLQFAACQGLPACSERLGDPRRALATLLERIDAGQMPAVRLRHPRTGEWREETLTRAHVVSVVRMYAYSPLSAALLPLSLSEAAQGRPELLMNQARMLTDSLGDQIAWGMQLSVICAEDLFELAEAPSAQGTLLGDALRRLVETQCEVWPRGRRPGDFRTPLAGDLPVLLLSGEFDPVTPPRYGDEVAATLPRSRHLVLRGQSHNVLTTACVPKLIARFLDTLDAAELDLSCLERLAPIPPFVGFFGWEP